MEPLELHWMFVFNVLLLLVIYLKLTIYKNAVYINTIKSTVDIRYLEYALSRTPLSRICAMFWVPRAHFARYLELFLEI